MFYLELWEEQAWYVTSDIENLVAWELIHESKQLLVIGQVIVEHQVGIAVFPFYFT